MAEGVIAFAFVLGQGRLVQLADLPNLLCKLLPILNVGMFPIATAVRV